jgi:hypothetical protein
MTKDGPPHLEKAIKAELFGRGAKQSRERKLEKKAADKNKAVEEKAAAIKAAAQAAAEAEIVRAADATAAAAGLCTVSPISACLVC